MTAPLLPVRRLGENRFAVTTPAKLNLFLEVERRRTDGYHDIFSLLLALDWGDLLVAEVLPAGASDELRVEGEMAPVDQTNLVLIALAAARQRRVVPPLRLHLRKRIPPGAGLGGGSGNAAGLLALVERVAPDPDGASAGFAVAAGVGSDVPFFLGPHAAAIARGRGEILEAFDGVLFGGERPGFVVVLPSIVSSTASAYARVSFPLTSPSGPISFPTRTFENAGGWRRGLFNRLENPVLATDSRLSELARRLRDFNREHRVHSDLVSSDRGSSNGWIMTGSGSAFFWSEQNRAGARRLEAALLSPDGPLAPYSAETGVAVVVVRGHPHPALFR